MASHKQVPFLPPEIWNKIMDYKKLMERKKTKKHYIAVRENTSQLVYVHSSHEGSDEEIYICSYGFLTSHDTYVKGSQLRELTNDEKTLLDNKQSFLLPQQFYQSVDPILC